MKPDLVHKLGACLCHLMYRGSGSRGRLHGPLCIVIFKTLSTSEAHEARKFDLLENPVLDTPVTRGQSQNNLTELEVPIFWPRELASGQRLKNVSIFYL
jgi:hypothetical protein